MSKQRIREPHNGNVAGVVLRKLGMETSLRSLIRHLDFSEAFEDTS